jgi:hypothetical protein
MKPKSIIAFAIIFFAGCVILNSCGGETSKTDQTTDQKSADATDANTSQSEVHGTEIKESDITLSTPLNAQMVADGKATYELKCQSCHKLTEEKLVGPGWEGVTKKRKPAWIMNMITNVDMMLETDPEAQKLLEQCLVRMPNQNISKDDAREVLEFMRNNDGEK